MISPSKRIFILTNENTSYDKGDFITLIHNSKKVARAIVAKINNNNGGIKILKIYSLTEWNRLATGIDVQILRGDDSLFGKRDDSIAGAEDGLGKIESDDDLYNETSISEDNLEVDENMNRAIKPDSLVSLSYGMIESLSLGGSTERYSQFLGQYAFQLQDNIWLEALYGQNVIKNYPNDGLDTKLTNITIRGKYAIAGPMYTIIKPYVGFQMKSSDSPGAGAPNDINCDATCQEQELEDVENLKENKLVFGVTALKRLVPGWFMRADLGTDIITFGFSLEF